MTLFEMIFTPDFFFAILRITAPILFATLGAVVAEKAGVTNIGLDGIMMPSQRSQPRGRNHRKR